MTQNVHERISHTEEIKSSSNRSFGIVFTVVFVIIGLWPLLNDLPPRTWSLVVAGAFLIIALVIPSLLAPLNRVWTKFGLLLHRIVNPVVLGLMFLIAVTPVALIMRALGKDPLHRNFDKDADSYWIARPEKGPAPESMRDQF